jgi:hypothetical protein
MYLGGYYSIHDFFYFTMTMATTRNSTQKALIFIRSSHHWTKRIYPKIPPQHEINVILSHFYANWLDYTVPTSRRAMNDT